MPFGSSAIASAKINVWIMSHIGHIFSMVAAMPCHCTAKCRLTVAKAVNIGGRREKFRAFPPTRKRARIVGLASAAMGAVPGRQEFVLEAFALANPSEIFVVKKPWISSRVFCFLRKTSTHRHLRQTD